ncbi:peroxisomal biogenesis factor 3-like [Teratosphaeria destructans]|uniref:Peroxisomal biogenesis factor 3-like n=1 Tax=Teratosphaeria destructans TaxID=418781 RepID=A0A9W7STH9_9PEZI|nr:peroxisomal biogenesis factor 3-like [Teratosphaeria destructans]
MHIILTALTALTLVATFLTLPLLHKTTTLPSIQPLPTHKPCPHLLPSDPHPTVNPYAILPLHHHTATNLTIPLAALRKARRDLWPLYPRPPAFPGDAEAYEAVDQAFDFLSGRADVLPGGERMKKREFDRKYRFAVQRTLCEGWNEWVKREALREREGWGMVWKAEMGMFLEAGRSGDGRGLLELIRAVLGSDLGWWDRVVGVCKERGEVVVMEGAVRYKNAKGQVREAKYPIPLPPVGGQRLSPLQWYLVYGGWAAWGLMSVLAVVWMRVRSQAGRPTRRRRREAGERLPGMETPGRCRRMPSVDRRERRRSSVGARERRKSTVRSGGRRVMGCATSCTGHVGERVEARHGRMIAATRRWFRRNRTNLVVGAGVIGAGYLAGQYVLGKIQEARQRMSEERISKENLRRRFQQNQEDCTYTVLALLPTIRDEILQALPVEEITEQLQQERQERLRRAGQSEAPSTEYPSVPPSIADEDGSKSMSSGSFVHASQMVGSGTDGGPALRPRKSKAQLWQDMKINSITRAFTLLYTLSLLTLLTRIQLNLLGRRTYLSSVVALANPPAAQQEGSTISLENRDDDNYDVYGNDFETNRKYLTFSWWLLHRGSRHIMERVMAAVKEVFGQVNIREDLTLERLADLIMQVRRKVEGATEEERLQNKWLTYLLPPREEESFVIRQAGMSSDSEGSPSPDAAHTEDPLEQDETIGGSLRRLLDETSDLVDSPTFSQVLTRLLDATYSHLVDYRIATEAYKHSPPLDSASAVLGQPAYAESRITEVSDVDRVKLAHILPVFCKQAHAIAAGSGDVDPMAALAGGEGAGLSNEYLAAIDQVHDLEAFAAVIYSSNFEYETIEHEHEQPTPPIARPPAAERSSSRTTIPVPAQQVAEAPETEPQEATRQTLQSTQTDLPPAPQTQIRASAPTTEATPTPAALQGNFEAAWQKAVAEDGNEDHGRRHEGEVRAGEIIAEVPMAGETPVPIPDEDAGRGGGLLK